MQVADRYTIEITDMGTEGEGIGRAEGMAVFVSGGIVGDKALIEISMVKKSFARGSMVELLEASPYRINPPCHHAGSCGGCSMQAMSYEGQLVLKKKWITDRLTRIGGLEAPPVADTIGMKDGVTAYRNKAQFPIQAGRLVKNKEGKYRNDKPCSVGFYRAKSHEVVHCDSCLIQSPPALAAAAAVKLYAEETGISIYDEKNGMGILRHLVVRSGFETGEVMVVIVVNGDHLPQPERLVELLDDAVNRIPCAEGNGQFWSLESVVLNVNKKKGSEVMGKDCITLAGKPTITDRIGGLLFEISPLSFYQVNPVQMKVLYDKVVEFAGLSGAETVLDLYCGVGTIGLYCAAKAGSVIGVESVRPAVLDANRNAVINGIVNAEFIYGRAEEVLPKRLSGIKADVVILDPPRAGCEPALLEAVMEVAPQRIVYVSCDPATQARDIKILTGGGQGVETAGGYEQAGANKASYRVEAVQPVDMFPGTGHIECVVKLCRAEK